MKLPTWLSEAVRTLGATAVFYWRCVVRAASGKFALAAGLTGGVSLIGLLIVAASNPAAGPERLITTSIPALVFVSVLVGAVLISLILAPVRLYEEEVRKREAVEALRKPRFSVSLPESGTVGISTRGGTTETRGGDRQTNISGWLSEVVCVICQNTGEIALRNVRARVMAATRRIADDTVEQIDIVEPIELTWKKDDLKTAFAKDLVPSEKCRAWIGGIRSQGQFWLYRDANDLPIEYQQVFGRAGEYHVLVQVDADAAAPVQVILRVLAAEGEKPVSGVHRGRAEVTLLAQGSPTVDWIAPPAQAPEAQLRRQKA